VLLALNLQFSAGSTGLGANSVLQALQSTPCQALSEKIAILANRGVDPLVHHGPHSVLRFLIVIFSNKVAWCGRDS
jgi:hypothetical protein